MVETNNKEIIRHNRALLLVLLVICALNLGASSLIFFKLWRTYGVMWDREPFGRQLRPYIELKTESMNNEPNQSDEEGLIRVLMRDANIPPTEYDRIPSFGKEHAQWIKKIEQEFTKERGPKIKVELGSWLIELKPNLAGEVQPQPKFTRFEKLIAGKNSERIAQWDALKPDAKKALAKEIKVIYTILAFRATLDSLDYEYIASNRNFFEDFFRACSWSNGDLLKDPNEILQLKSEYFQDLQAHVRSFEKVMNNLLTTQAEK